MPLVIQPALALLPGSFISWILVGLIAGALASRVVEGRGLGCLGDIVVGVAGAIIGGIVLSAFVVGSVGFFGSIVVAFIGAVILLGFVRLVTGRR